MYRHAFFFVLACALPLCAQTNSGSNPKLQALIITGQNGHDWRATTPVLREMLEATGRFEVRVTEEFRGAGPATLAPYDLVILNYFDGGRPERRWGDAADTALLEHVKSGKGVVVYHFSVAAFNGWTEYEKMSAGNWRPSHGHHSARHDFTVKIADSTHPITKDLKLSFQQPNDELYANLKWQPEGTYHVLATAWDDHSLYGGKARQPIPGAGLDQPMLWTTEYGKGRVFVTALGHDVTAVKTPAFVTTFTRGCEWAATGRVTLAVPLDMTATGEKPASE
jgi:type 1 glutamine amidotransferase